MTALSFQTLSVNFPAGYRNIFIGYSGGIDSHVLLHLCASEPDIRKVMTAVYIHHGLQVAADEWGRHCETQCQRLDVDFKMLKVDAAPKTGESPESAALNARYQALRSLLGPHDLLLVAQHREDQMETLLLQLFRGSGIQGLAAMPVVMKFGQGFLVRPLLEVSKQAIQNYAEQHALQWIEDPSNRDNAFDRNFLRNQVVPLLKQRWPSLDKTVSRAARHCASSVRFTDEWLEQAFPQIFAADDNSLFIEKWLQFSENNRAILLRHWLTVLGLKPPGEAFLQAVISEVINSKETANAQVFTQGYYIKRYRQKLYCLAESCFIPETKVREWPSHESEFELLNGYKLQRTVAESGINKNLWHKNTITIKSRCGGEKLKLPGRDGHHCLKNLYQEAGVPPWEREIRPLIYLDGHFAAVAGLWVAEWAWQQDTGECYQVMWRQPGKNLTYI